MVNCTRIDCPNCGAWVLKPCTSDYLCPQCGTDLLSNEDADLRHELVDIPETGVDIVVDMSPRKQYTLNAEMLNYRRGESITLEQGNLLRRVIASNRATHRD